jgi:ribonuclease G
LVQVLKEPISTKGPRLGCEITIPGRYMVLTPFADHVAVSKKIASQEERQRLKVLVESIKPKKFGIIVRTAAEGKKVADLHNEIRELAAKWEKIYEELRESKGPGKMLSEADKTISILRDILSENFTKIVVNDKDMFYSIRDYMKSISPEKVNIVQFYDAGKGIFDQFGVTRQIKASFGKTSTMSSGAYIVIEHTEAMHVIDVNSGPKVVKKDQEESSLSVNLEAAEEIARQLRLRDIGGIIIVDFIDMRQGENKQELYKAMREFMKNDRAQHTVLPLSKFGLMQITRQRVRPAVKIDTSEQCPVCKGSGKSISSLLITDYIERDLNYIFQSNLKRNLILKTHPFIKAYLTEGWPSRRMKWFFQYRKWIKIIEDSNFDLFTYKFYDDSSDEIRLE